MALCNHPNSPIPAAPCEAGGISDQSLRDALADALSCLPLIDKGNGMVDKCAKFVATLQQCLNLLGTFSPRRKTTYSVLVYLILIPLQTKPGLTIRLQPGPMRMGTCPWLHLGPATMGNTPMFLYLLMPSILISLRWVGRRRVFCRLSMPASWKGSKKRICFVSIVWLDSKAHVDGQR